MRTGDFFKSRFLKPVDFPEPKVVVLVQVGTESFRDSPEPKPVVYFKGVQKPLILNKTMAQFLEDVSGTDVMTDWAGTKVEIFATSVEVNGQTKPCLRLRTPDQAELPTRRPIKPSEPHANGNDDMDDEIPF
jgi:hypothetical protein